MRFRVELVVGQLLDFQATKTSRFGFTETLGKAQKRFVVFGLVRVGRVGLGLTVWR